MIRGESKKSFLKPLSAALLAAMLMAAPALGNPEPAGGGRRYLVRYDHGTANLPP